MMTKASPGEKLGGAFMFYGDVMLRLKFMVVPEKLGRKAYVPNRVKLKIIRPNDLLFL